MLEFDELAERVFTQEDGRLYERSAIEVWLPGGPTPRGLYCFDKLQGVYRDAKDAKAIGAANLSRSRDTIIADLWLAYDSPERLDIENGEQLYLVPVIEEDTEAAGRHLLAQRILRAPLAEATYYRITRLVLSRQRHPDSRILPIRPG
jgi:hypothetical protein